MSRPDVEDLVGRYCEAVLRNDPVAYGTTWCLDAVWIMPGRGEVTGRQEIVATFSALRVKYTLCVQQVLNGVVTTVDDDHATAAWQVRELQWLADGTSSELIGIYHDVLDRSPSAGWQFARRRFELVYNGPVDLPGRVRRPE